MEKIQFKIIGAVTFLVSVLFIGCSSDDATTTEPELLYWEKVYPGWQQTIAMRSDGTIWAWGMNNAWGQLGIGTSGIGTGSVTPIQIGTENDWVKLAHGSLHTLAIKSNGTLWAWGLNINGQLGNNSTYQKDQPIQIGTDNDWTAVGANINSSIALKSNGSLWAWGDNDHGEVGDGTLDDRLVPTQIAGNGWIAIAAGNTGSLALKNDGSIWAWGAINNQINLVPVQVAVPASWAKISGGGFSSHAIKTNGTLWAMGTGYQTGLGSFGPFAAYTQVGDDADWEMISTGDLNTIALKSDGTLWSWGGNLYGELGNGTTNVPTGTPAQIGVGSNWEYIAEENTAHHTFARKTDKTLWGFGWNYAGQLGNGTQTDSNVPVLIPCPQ